MPRPATTRWAWARRTSNPPALADPATPGFTINSGADQPNPDDKVPQNVPVRSGTQVGQWAAPTDALPDPPAWAAPGVMWAPDVAQFGNHYMLYFTSAGPYIVPFICQQALGGSIDPRVFDNADRQP